jgi:hypothetical protein
MPEPEPRQRRTGEAFSAGQGAVNPGVDREQNPGGQITDKIAENSGYRLLPKSFSAVVRDIQSSPTDFKFTIQIGRVRYKNPGQLAPRDVTLGFTAANYTHIPRGTHAGDMVVLPISDGSSSSEKYEIDIIGTPGGNEAKLGLYVRGDKRKLVREGTIDTSELRDLDPNFDFDPANPNNHGLKLSHQLSQRLYDFQIDQEPPEQQEKQLTTRRTLRSRSPSRSRSTVRYDLSANVEANLEDQFLSLMQDYLALATALGPQSSVAKLEALADQEITVYLNNGDTGVKRRMEGELRGQLDDLQTTGFERTLNMLVRFRKDAGESEKVVYDFQVGQLTGFASTKKDRKTKMIVRLIELKRSIAVANFDGYRDAWLALFPTGPRTIYWKGKWEKAETSGDQIAIAEISEGLREELGKKLVAKAHNCLEEVQVLNIDAGMPTDLAEQKTSSQESEFRSSPLSVKVDVLKALQDRADASLLLLFLLNVRLWGSIIGDSRDEVVAQLNHDFNKASTHEKVRMSRDLYQRFKTELDAAIEDYAMQVHLVNKERGLVKVAEYWNLSQIKAKLRSLPRSEQLRIITSGEII